MLRFVYEGEILYLKPVEEGGLPLDTPSQKKDKVTTLSVDLPLVLTFEGAEDQGSTAHCRKVQCGFIIQPVFEVVREELLC
jgi:hypothetical protein